MKYLSYRVADAAPTWGVSIDGTVYNLGLSGLGLASSLDDAVKSDVFGRISETLATTAPHEAESDISFLPPLGAPGKIICIGVNYRTHQEESGKTGQVAPTVFFRFADTQMGHLQPAVYPKVSEQFDYEGELALVIGRDAWRVEVADAFNYITGYGIYNDFSARDWQRAASQWGPGKNFAATGAFGPYLVPEGDVDDVASLRLQTRVNGEVRQDAVVADMVFDIPTLLSYVTTFTRLAPGDVIVTGTPGGVGLFSEGLLQPGDVVDVEITGLGTLTNTVAAEE